MTISGNITHLSGRLDRRHKDRSNFLIEVRLENTSDSPVEKWFACRSSSSNPVSCDKLAKQSNKSAKYAAIFCLTLSIVEGQCVTLINKYYYYNIIYLKQNSK